MLKIRNKNDICVVENIEVINAIETGVFPYFIRHEYSRFYKMITQRQYTGAWFELRDVIEVMLKIPVFLGLSYLFSQDSELEDTEIWIILNKMLTQSLSLGDWNDLLKKLSRDKKINGELPKVSLILNRVDRFMDEYQVIQWRNDMIGHGALPFEDSDEFIDKICTLAEGVDLCLEKTIDAYSSITIYDSGLFANVDGKKFDLDKCIFEKEFFFDKFNTDKMEVYSLNYLEGTKRLLDVEWYRNVAVRDEIAKKLEYCRKRRTTGKWTWYDVMNLQKLNKPRQYQKNKRVMKWLEKCMKDPKGIFLLTMDRGMGKTAFVSSINQLTNSVNIDEWYTRVYYCSALKYRSMDDFVLEFNSLFKMSRNAEDTVVANGCRELNKKDGRKEFAECLADILEKARDEALNEKLKLLFVIDGIDEIYDEGNRKNIFDFIPYKENLTEGVYILLTARNGETEPLTDYSKFKIEELKRNSISQVYDFSLKNPDDAASYKKMMRRYYDCTVKTLHQKYEFIDPDDQYFDKMCEQSHYRFVEFRLYIDLLKETVRNKKDIQTVFSEENSFKDFFQYMKQVLGEKLYHKAGRILLIIATAFTPLTIGDCIFLERLEEDCNVVEILAILQIFESFFVYKRDNQSGINNSTVIESANATYQSAIINEFGFLMDELVEDWITFVEDQYQNSYMPRRCYDPKTDYTFPRIYIHANIYRYVLKSGNEDFINRIHEREFVNAIFQYEKYMPAKELGLKERDLDMDMSYSCIQLLKGKPIEGDMLLAAAYNSYVYHKKDVYMETWNTNIQNPKAISEKEEILKCFEEAIQCIRKADMSQINVLELRSKLCSLKGVFLYGQNERLDEVEQLFWESYDMTKEILSLDVKLGCTLYLQAAERVLSILGKREKPELLSKLYSEIVEELSCLKRSEEISPYLKVNFRNRIEYGILPREAMLYRKIATTGQAVNWIPENVSIEELYNRSESILRELQADQDLQVTQIEIIDDYLRIVLNEHGKFEQKRGNILKAKQLFDETTSLAESLIDKNKLRVNKYIVNASLDYVNLCCHSDCEEMRLVEKRLELTKKWIQEWFKSDQQLQEYWLETKETYENNK